MKPSSLNLSHGLLTAIAVLVVCLTQVLLQSDYAESSETVVRVMSFNLWQGGDGGKQPFERTVAVVKESQADIVGLQETAGVAPDGHKRPDHGARLAKQLGWYYFDQGSNRGIISRWKIIEATPHKLGCKLRLHSGQHLYCFNVHFPDRPYQPYQLLGSVPKGLNEFVL